VAKRWRRASATSSLVRCVTRESNRIVRLLISKYRPVYLASEYIRRGRCRVEEEVIGHIVMHDCEGPRCESKIAITSSCFASDEFVEVTIHSDPISVDKCALRLLANRRVNDHMVYDQINTVLPHFGPKPMRESRYLVELFIVFRYPAGRRSIPLYDAHTRLRRWGTVVAWERDVGVWPPPNEHIEARSEQRSGPEILERRDD